MCGVFRFGSFLAHEEMSVVTVASVSGVHLEHVEAAARAGKHIICEKPLEVTTARIDQMIKTCDEAGVMLAGIFPAPFQSIHGNFPAGD